ncbi:MAG TPA: STAS/SEC14 domain-containing protein [Terracidiphilus sp.]|nr:STAS/SEC14 domain-containing protein [Terracidiphilus sp.]
MPIAMSEESNGRILVIQVSGKLAAADYGDFTAEFERLLRKYGKLRVLFDMKDFHGWEAGAAWEDLKFDVKHFADIDRLAMIGETTWEHGMAELFRPFTRAKTRFFDHAKGSEARRWLLES